MWNVIIELVTGGLGGACAGKLFPKISLGKVGNIVAGIVGGIGGGQLLHSLGIGTHGTDLAGILTSILGGVVGGGALEAIVSGISKLVAKKK